MRAPVTPSLGLDSFSCPHCGALSHQYWFKVHPANYERKIKPVVAYPDDIKNRKLDREEDEESKRDWVKFVERIEKNFVTYTQHKYGQSSTWEMVNLYLSRCHSCEAFSVWVGVGLVYPSTKAAIVPHEDTPADVKSDLLEASAIVDRSPRGAAALLRLAVQKLLPHLGEKGDNINTSIGNLVAKGLDTKVQKALDVVRVIGNNAVHPGQIDMKDDKATAMNLFSLVNIIVQATISTQKQIDAMYDELPAGALAQIAKRDGA